MPHYQGHGGAMTKECASAAASPAFETRAIRLVSRPDS